MKAIASIIAFAVAAYAEDSQAVKNKIASLPTDTCWALLVEPESVSTTVSTSSAPTLITLGGGFVGNYMPGWIDQSTINSKFFDFPESQLGNAAYIPPWNIAPNSFLRLFCADSVGKKCDIYINLYKCSGCEVGLNEDFSNYLVTNGWTPSQCGPKFISDAGEESHKFMTYRKQISAWDIERVEFNSNVKLMFLTMEPVGVDCSDFPINKCETSGFKQCKVIKGECVDDWCPKTFQGPSQNGGGGGCLPPCGRGGCNNCALKEAAFQ